MELHKEGLLFIVIAISVAVVGIALVWLLGKSTTLKVAVSVLLAFLAAIIVFFFRVPERTVTVDPALVVSPSDGKVVKVQKTYVKEYFDCECTEISIFLNLFNVHITWFPVGGDIVYSKYYPGAHWFAFLPKESEKNEHTSVVVRSEDGREVMYRQIAGIVARRVVSYAVEGEKCDQASEAGFIKFGSRLTIFIPGDVEPLVKVGDKVTGSVTPLARKK